MDFLLINISWIILLKLASTTRDINITSTMISPTTFNVTCYWKGSTPNMIIFFRHTGTLSNSDLREENVEFYYFLQINNTDRVCDVKSSLTSECTCALDHAVRCIIHINLVDQHIEHWKCAIPVDESLAYSNILNVTHREPAKIKSFKVDFSASVFNATLIENTNASLRCNAVGYPKPNISMYKDDQATVGKYEVRSENNITSELDYKLTPALRNHSGKYACVASNKHGKNQQELYVNVLYPPVVVRLEDELIKEGEILNKSCIYQCGNPQETQVRWTKAGSFLSHGVFLIKKVARTDAGIYTCSAINRYEQGQTNFTGVDSQQFNMHVLYQPLVHTFFVESYNDTSNVTIYENDSVIFHCVGEGLPPPEMRLLKDSITLDDCDNERQINMSTRLRCVIKSAGITDNGKYACFASNTIGLGGRELTLNILYPVRRDLTQTSDTSNGNQLTGHIDGNVPFTFFAIANPLPTISEITLQKCTDTSPCTEITTSSRVYIDTNGKNISLKIANITESDYGMYILQVGNGVGKRHTEVYYLKRPIVQLSEANPSVKLIVIFSAGASASVIIAIVVVVVCVYRHYIKTASMGNVGIQMVVPTTSAIEDDSLQYQTSSSESSGDQSVIYHEIDPRLSLFETTLVDDGALNAPLSSAEAYQFEDLDRTEQSGDPQYIRAVAD
ncbi:hemicentin-1-like [Dreissena polymorpha]|uniref:hemicentin-1-like n=1 Tax=Dreissena polymorpha TaxID=45954 RepID=UPI0022643FC4|nr:hemicentin-1-like [Dreissena polymorpha]